MITSTTIVNYTNGTEFTRSYKIHHMEAYFTDGTYIRTRFHIRQRLEPRFSPQNDCHGGFLASQYSNLNLPTHRDNYKKELVSHLI
jgi:hypothetical protein